MASPDASALKQATTRCLYPKVLVRPGQLFYLTYAQNPPYLRQPAEFWSSSFLLDRVWKAR